VNLEDNAFFRFVSEIFPSDIRDGPHESLELQEFFEPNSYAF